MQPTADFNPSRLAKSLLRKSRQGALATLMAGTGAPYCSLVNLASHPDGSPILLISRLALHTRNILADGTAHYLSFNLPIKQSCWVALRIRASSHTNPIFVLVGDKPIRASKRSLDWCLKSVEQCWSQKERAIAPAEKADAVAAYDHARQVYRKRLQECETD